MGVTYGSSVMARQTTTINHTTNRRIDADGAIHPGEAVVTILEQRSQPSGVTPPLSMEPTQ